MDGLEAQRRPSPPIELLERSRWRVNPAFGVHAVAHHDARCNAMWSSSRAAKARDSTGSLLRSPRLVDTHAAWGVSRTTTCAAGVECYYGPVAGQRLVRGPCAVGSLSIVASYGWRAPCTTGEGGRGGGPKRKGRRGCGYVPDRLGGVPEDAGHVVQAKARGAEAVSRSAQQRRKAGFSGRASRDGDEILWVGAAAQQRQAHIGARRAGVAVPVRHVRQQHAVRWRRVARRSPLTGPNAASPVLLACAVGRRCRPLRWPQHAGLHRPSQVRHPSPARPRRLSQRRSVGRPALQPSKPRSTLIQATGV